MASSYSELKFELISTGEQSGTWGSTTNSNIGTAINEAIAGAATIAISGNTTLPWLNTVASQDARNMALFLTDGGVSANYELVVPAIHKPYAIVNISGYTATVKTASGTGVDVPTGKSALVYVDGTNVAPMINYLPSLTLGTALALANGGTGSTGVASGVVTSNGTAFSSIAQPAGDLVGTTATQTISNKAITSRIASVASAGATATPNGNTTDQYIITAQDQAVAFANITGSPVDGQKLIIRIKDNGTPRAITWSSGSGGYRPVGASLPTTTAANKVTYIGCIYNSSALYWDVIAVAQEV